MPMASNSYDSAFGRLFGMSFLLFAGCGSIFSAKVVEMLEVVVGWQGEGVDWDQTSKPNLVSICSGCLANNENWSLSAQWQRCQVQCSQAQSDSRLQTVPMTFFLSLAWEVLCVCECARAHAIRNLVYVFVNTPALAPVWSLKNNLKKSALPPPEFQWADSGLVAGTITHWAILLAIQSTFHCSSQQLKLLTAG